jgi:hypothetical protein
MPRGAERRTTWLSRGSTAGARQGQSAIGTPFCHQLLEIRNEVRPGSRHASPADGIAVDRRAAAAAGRWCWCCSAAVWRGLAHSSRPTAGGRTCHTATCQQPAAGRSRPAARSPCSPQPIGRHQVVECRGFVCVSCVVCVGAVAGRGLQLKRGSHQSACFKSQISPPCTALGARGLLLAVRWVLSPGRALDAPLSWHKALPVYWGTGWTRWALVGLLPSPPFPAFVIARTNATDLLLPGSHLPCRL